MGSPCLFTRHQALKRGIFIGWALKIRFTFTQNYQGKSLLLETHKILSWKWSFFYIQISSIALFKPFLIAWLWWYCTFLGSSVVRSLLYLFCYFRFASPWPKYTQYGTIFQKKKNHVLLSNFFSSSTVFFIRLFLAINCKNKIGGHLACFLKNCRKRWARFWERSRDGEFARRGLGRNTK